MFERVYIVLGSLLLLGYAVVAWEGWEFGNPVKLRPAPPAGATLSSSGTYHHSGSRSGVIIINGGK
jgi:hypothetical protein